MHSKRDTYENKVIKYLVNKRKRRLRSQDKQHNYTRKKKANKKAILKK